MSTYMPNMCSCSYMHIHIFNIYIYIHANVHIYIHTYHGPMQRPRMEIALKSWAVQTQNNFKVVP